MGPPRSPHLHFPPARVAALLAALFLLLFPLPLHAQPKRPAVTVSATLNASQILPGQQHVLAVVARIPQGLHAQSATPSSEDYIPFSLSLTGLPPGLTALTPVYPPGVNHTYPLLGTLNVYEGTVVAYIPLVADPSLTPGTALELKGTLQSQLCNDNTCFPPTSVSFTLTTSVAPASSASSLPPLSPADAELFRNFDWSTFSRASLPPATRPAPAAASRDVTLLGLSLTEHGKLVAFLGAFLVGLIFNVMPCVLPVLPLKAVGFIEAAAKSRLKSVLLGVVFSAGIISVFAALALAIFAHGLQWGFLFQFGWFVYPMSVILLLMAASQWGLFTVRVPLGVYTLEPRHDTISGNFLFGILTALLSTPCTAPIFPALLLWAASQPLATGILLLITVGLGMALPYFALSCFPQLARKVPRTGPWSEIIKQFMGFLILATAVYFACTKLLTGFQFLYPVTAILLAGSVFLIYRTARLLPRPVPIAISVLLALGLSSASVATTLHLNQPSVTWTAYSDDALAAARKKGQTVLIDFTATWCANCHYIEATVFSDKRVQRALLTQGVLLLKVDITNPDAPGSELLSRFNPAGGIPLTVIYPPNKEPVQLPGIYTATQLLETLSSTN